MFLQCPSCNQDYVYEVLIVPLNLIIYSCPECDSTWGSIQQISPIHPELYKNYLTNLGITEVDQQWSPEVRKKIRRLTTEDLKKENK